MATGNAVIPDEEVKIEGQQIPEEEVQVSADKLASSPGTIGPAPSAWSPIAHAAVNSSFPYIHPIDALEKATEPIENYTQEGRAEHPVLSRMGDVTKGVKDLGDIVGPEAGLLSGAESAAEILPKITEGIPEALNAARNATARLTRQPYTGIPKKGIPSVPLMPWVREMLLPRGEEGTITNPLVVRRDEIPTIEPGKFYKTTPVRLSGATPNPAASIPSMEGSSSMSVPLRPLIGSESDWRTHDQLMNILKPEAKDAGTFHAARGSAKAPRNLQERIGRKLSE